MKHNHDSNNDSLPEKCFSVVWGIVLSLWLCFFPLWTGASYTNITASKNKMMLLLFSVTVLVFIVTIFCHIAFGKGILHLPPKPVLVLTALYFAWMVLSCVFGKYSDSINRSGKLAVIYGGYRHEGMIAQVCYIGLLLIFASVRPHMRTASVAAGLGVTCFFAVVIMQYLGMNPLGLFPAGRSVRTNYEFQGTIGNIDMVCGYLSLMIPLLFLSFVFCKKSAFEYIAASLATLLLLFTDVQSGLIALCAFALMLIFLFMTSPLRRKRILMVLSSVAFCFGVSHSVRFPWLHGVGNIEIQLSKFTLVVIAASLVLFIFSQLFYGGKSRVRPGKAALVLLAVCATAAVSVAVLPITERFGGLFELHQILTGKASDSFGSYRWGVWRQTLAMSGKNLLFGTGGDTFMFAFRDFIAKEGVTFPEMFDNPHNIFLSVLSSYGLPALALFVGMLLSSLIPALKNCRRSFIFAGAAVCFLAQGFFTFSICIVSPMFYAVLGVAAANDD